MESERELFLINEKMPEKRFNEYKFINYNHCCKRPDF